jgi:hypothetical protein
VHWSGVVTSIPLDPADEPSKAAARVSSELPLDPFAGEGPQMATFRAHDWSATPLGAESTWSLSLRRSVEHVLWSDFPNLLLWGPDFLQLYNESYRALRGDLGASELGRPVRESSPKYWDINAPFYDRAMAGETLSRENVLMSVTRAGKAEDVRVTLSYKPIFVEHAVGGVMVTVFHSQQDEDEASHLASDRMVH